MTAPLTPERIAELRALVVDEYVRSTDMLAVLSAAENAAKWRAVAEELAGALRLWGRNAQWDQCRMCECEWANVKDAPEHSDTCDIGDALARYDAAKKEVI